MDFDMEESSRIVATKTISKYLDMNGNPVEPERATKKVVSVFDADGNIVQTRLEFSRNGFPENTE